MDDTFSKYWQVAGWPGKHLSFSTELLSSRNSGAKRVARSCWQLTSSAQSSAAAMKPDIAAIAAPVQIFMFTKALQLTWVQQCNSCHLSQVILRRERLKPLWWQNKLMVMRKGKSSCRWLQLEATKKLASKSNYTLTPDLIIAFVPKT